MTRNMVLSKSYFVRISLSFLPRDWAKDKLKLFSIAKETKVNKG